MKFYGKRVQLERRTQENIDCQKWHKFFCVLPKTIDNVTIWMESVERKAKYNGYQPDFKQDNEKNPMTITFNWEYRIPIEETFRQLTKTNSGWVEESEDRPDRQSL